MNFFGKDFELFFFSGKDGGEMLVYTKISETGGRKGNAYYQKGLSFKKTTVQMYLQHLF